MTEPAKPSDDEPTSRVGRRFLHRYSAFLSSFVIGIAGLVATSIWQYRQSEIAQQQAESQQKVAETQAENQWRIERAEILAKNLSVLSAQGPDSVEQRYGVLLSLTRGNILDPELAVSYALELGKDNPDYMESVLANTADKDYHRLSRSYIAVVRGEVRHRAQRVGLRQRQAGEALGRRSRSSSPTRRRRRRRKDSRGRW